MAPTVCGPRPNRRASSAAETPRRTAIWVRMARSLEMRTSDCAAALAVLRVLLICVMHPRIPSQSARSASATTTTLGFRQLESAVRTALASTSLLQSSRRQRPVRPQARYLRDPQSPMQQHEELLRRGHPARAPTCPPETFGLAPNTMTAARSVSLNRAKGARLLSTLRSSSSLAMASACIGSRARTFAP